MEMDGIYNGLQKPSEDVYSTVNQPQSRRARAEQGDPTAGKAPPYRRAALVLAGLCALSVAANIFLTVYISNLTVERKQIQYRHSELEKNYSNISEKYSALDQYCPITDPSSKERVCKACQVNWVLFNGKCYYFSTDRMNWTSSRYNCTSLGGHLVIIESEAEQEFIHSQVRRIRDFFWIGLSDEVTEGEFLWVDNTPPSTTYWKVNEPDNTLIFEGNQYPNADCAVIDYKVAPLQSWSDTRCSVLVRRVCETISAIPAGLIFSTPGYPRAADRLPLKYKQTHTFTALLVAAQHR